MLPTIIILAILLCIFFAWAMALRGEIKQMAPAHAQLLKDYNTLFQRDEERLVAMQEMRDLAGEQQATMRRIIADLDAKSVALEEANKEAARWTTAAGIAEAKLAGSRVAGAVESWQQRARTAEKKADEARQALKAAERKMELDKTEIAILQETIVQHTTEIRRQRERCSLAVLAVDGQFWIWSEDEDNHLESLRCPVVIGSRTLRAIVERAEKAEADMKRLTTPRPIEELHEDHGNVLAFTIEDDGAFGGDVALVHLCDTDFNESDYTHFIPMPNITEPQKAKPITAADVATPISGKPEDIKRAMEQIANTPVSTPDLAVAWDALFPHPELLKAGDQVEVVSMVGNPIGTITTNTPHMGGAYVSINGAESGWTSYASLRPVPAQVVEAPQS